MLGKDQDCREYTQTPDMSDRALIERQRVARCSSELIEEISIHISNHSRGELILGSLEVKVFTKDA